MPTKHRQPSPTTKRAIISTLLAMVISASLLNKAIAKEEGNETQRLNLWKAKLWQEAKTLGISHTLFQQALQDFKPNYALPRVHRARYWHAVQRAARAPKKKIKTITKNGLPPSCTRPRQKEFLFPTLYFPKKYLHSLVQRGKRLRQKHKTTLQTIEQRYGVDMRAVLGIWGRETAFGQVGNKHNGIRTWASLAYAGAPEKRADHRQNLLYALKMIDEGHIGLKAYKTTFAGATGYPQFTPDVFALYAVDFDGDGRKNIWSSVPDALASAANYLKGIGWQQGVPWGYEVDVPKGFNCAVEGPKARQPVADWMKLGVRRVADPKGGRPPFPDEHVLAQFVAPAGMLGPKFLVTENFEVFRRYNKADLYALFVGHLGDKIWCSSQEKCSFKHPWPQTDTFNFSRKRICEMQRHLKRLAASTETPDGLFGGKTRNGIGTYERQIGQQPTCFPNKALLQHLKTSDAQR